MTKPPPATPTDRPAQRRPMQGDLTQGPILKTLMVFSVPTLLSNLLQTLNGTVNSIWAGRLLGESALAATANANIIMILLFGAVFGLGMATTIRVGQAFGARDMDNMRRNFGAGVGFCVTMSACAGILGSIFAPALLQALGTPEASRVEALSYLRVVFLTVPFGAVSMMVSTGLRGIGDSRTPMRSMVLTVALDACLNPLLIRGFGPIPSLGIAGSAMATAFANLAGSVMMIWTIYRRNIPLRLRKRELRYLIAGRSEINYMLAKGLPMGAQMLLVSMANVIMMGLVNRQGLSATAAYGASLQIWGFLQMPAFALGAAVSAMVAQNVGAGNHARVGAVTATGVAVNLVLTSFLAGLILIFDRPIMSLFLTGHSPALPIASHIQYICTWSFILQGVIMVLSGTMRAYGAVILPMVALFISLYPARLGFYYFAFPYLGGEAVWWSFPVGAITSVILNTANYRFGAWRKELSAALANGGKPA